MDKSNNRRLSSSQKETISRLLKAPPVSCVVVACVKDDAETWNYASDYVAVLRGVGWDVIGPKPTEYDQVPIGVYVGVSDCTQPNQQAERLFSAITQAGITMTFDHLTRCQDVGSDTVWLQIGDNRYGEVSLSPG